MSLIPGQDKCPKCGAYPLIYNASSGYTSSIAVCSVCLASAYELKQLADARGMTGREMDIRFEEDAQEVGE